MIQNKKTLATFPTVEIVLSADGVGGPDSKITKYDKMMNEKVYPFIKYRAFKIFTNNPLAGPQHSDRPQMDWDWTFGKKPTPNGAKMTWPPDVIIVA